MNKIYAIKKNSKGEAVVVSEVSEGIRKRVTSRISLSILLVSMFGGDIPPNQPLPERFMIYPIRLIVIFLKIKDFSNLVRWISHCMINLGKSLLR